MIERYCPKCGSVCSGHICYYAGIPVVEWYCSICGERFQNEKTYASTSTKNFASTWAYSTSLGEIKYEQKKK